MNLREELEKRGQHRHDIIVKEHGHTPLNTMHCAFACAGPRAGTMDRSQYGHVLAKILLNDPKGQAEAALAVLEGGDE